jgi:arylsulfatase A-like enzyme
MIKRWMFFAGLFLLICGSGLKVSAKKREKDKKPNVLFVMCDQFRKQSLGFMKQDPVITPRLDEFAKQAVVFTNAVATRPICTPNRATILTGQYPIHHGVYGNSVRMAISSVSMGDVAKDAGYSTAYIGKWHLDGPNEGYVPAERRQGFDHWILENHHNPFQQKYYIGDSQEAFVPKDSWEPDWITDKAIEFIEKQEEEPFFMVVSYGPPHTGGGKGFEDRWQPGKRSNGKIKYGYGYAAPREFENLYPNPDDIVRRKNVKPVGEFNDPSAHTLPGYFGAISSIDANFGRLLDVLKEMGELENTIVVFTSDHGEMLGSQGRMTKGVWYEESSGIPFLISYPEKVKQKMITSPFNTIDMMPTVVGLMGADVPPVVDGTDFSPFLKGQKMKLPNAAFMSFDQGSPGTRDRAWRGIKTERYTFVMAKVSRFSKTDPLKDGIVLFDNEKDPYQMNPIFRGMGYDDVIDELQNRLEKHLKETGDNFVEKQWKTGPEPTLHYNNAEDKGWIDEAIKADEKEEKGIIKKNKN